MLKDKLYIQDSIFAHAFSSSWWNKPTHFEWVRNTNSDKIILTDNHLTQVENLSGKKIIGWLIESPAITPSAYKYIFNNYDKFDKVYTFKKTLLDMSNKFELLPSGNCWILPDDRKVHSKTKLISIISSNKKQTYGQQLRHKIINTHNNIDVYGNGYNPIDNKISGLKDYMFSVVIENHREDYFFTEKLIDCLVTGTIPIYYGCPSISKFFDDDAILSFTNQEEFNKIISNLDEKFYNSKLKNIKNNFSESLKYVIADDILYKKINNE